MNVRRSVNNGVRVSPLSEPTSTDERGTLNAKAFRRMIALERKRSERSRKPFILLLLDMGDQPSDKNGTILGKISSVLSASTRDTDVTGWYSNDCVVGVMFTEIAAEDNASILGTVIARVTDTLRNNLALEQFNRVRISFHVFPEEFVEGELVGRLAKMLGEAGHDPQVIARGDRRIVTALEFLQHHFL